VLGPEQLGFLDAERYTPGLAAALLGNVALGGLLQWSMFVSIDLNSALATQLVGHAKVSSPPPIPPPHHHLSVSVCPGVSVSVSVSVRAVPTLRTHPPPPRACNLPLLVHTRQQHRPSPVFSSSPRT
jgi:hypothetical protein